MDTLLTTDELKQDYIKTNEKNFEQKNSLKFGDKD